jgi:hypothetical protein
MTRPSVLGLALLAAVGCGRTSQERYVPSGPDARQALEAALGAWQGGQAPGPIASATPAVVAVDTERRPGQQLRSYSIVGELGGDGPRCFVVRLVLDARNEEQKARFVVFGINPVWVYRQEDFDRLVHWECRMSTEPTRDPEQPAVK